MTSLYLTTATATASGATETTKWKLAGSAGASARICNKNTVAGNTTPIGVTDSQTAGTDGNSLAWYSDPVNTVTISGTITASLWGVESATAANAAPCIGVYRCDSTGAVLSAIVDPAVVGSQGGLEFATTAGAKTCTIASGTVVSTALNSGDRIKVTLCIDDAVDQGGSGTMASGRTTQLYVNGATGSSGQSQIAFTETIISSNQIAFAKRPTTPRIPLYRAAYW